MNWSSKLGPTALKVGSFALAAGIVWKLFAPSEALAAQAPLIAGKRRILLIGDSFGAGIAPTLERLVRASGREFVGMPCAIGEAPSKTCTAIVGSSVLQWRYNDWIGKTLERFRPDLVLVSLGTNDFAKGAGQAAEIRNAVRDVHDAIVAAGATPVWVAPVEVPIPDSASVRQAWSGKFRNVFDSRPLKYVRSEDGVHPVGSAYADWAQRVWSWMNATPKR